MTLYPYYCTGTWVPCGLCHHIFASCTPNNYNHSELSTVQYNVTLVVVEIYDTYIIHLAITIIVYTHDVCDM